MNVTKPWLKQNFTESLNQTEKDIHQPERTYGQIKSVDNYYLAFPLALYGLPNEGNR